MEISSPLQLLHQLMSSTEGDSHRSHLRSHQWHLEAPVFHIHHGDRKSPKDRVVGPRTQMAFHFMAPINGGDSGVILTYPNPP